MQPFSTLHRRAFLSQASYGFGAAALANLLGNDAAAATASSLTPMPLFAPKAKRVIFLSMAGGPSHLETFDYKPV